MPGINRAAAAPVVPLTTFEGAGRAAKRVVDDKFGAFASQAALTTPQETARASFSFTAGVNLLDVTDPAVRTPDAADVADWMAQTGRKAQRVQRRHHFNKDRSTDEEGFLATEVLAPFVAARLADLELFDRFGFAMADEAQVFIVPRVLGSARFPATAPATGGPSPAERKRRWDMWQTLVHEYIHTLEHPEFVRARGGNRILFEGFCEMFTEEVLREWIPKARADADAALRTEVEGTDPAGAPWPGFRRAFVARRRRQPARARHGRLRPLARASGGCGPGGGRRGAGAGRRGARGDAGGHARDVPHPPARGGGAVRRAGVAGGDLVGVLEVREPPLREPLDAQLGEPEARVPSGLGGSYRQWVYANRGLVFHVSAVTRAVLRLYAFPAIETDAFLAHPLSQVARRRIPRA